MKVTVIEINGVNKYVNKIGDTSKVIRKKEKKLTTKQMKL